MDQPQSPAEIQPVVDAIRHELDRRLDVRWNPHVLVLEAARIDASGHTVPARYDGRWEVIIRDTENLRTAGGPHDASAAAVVYQVRDAVTNDYKPIGWWLVDYLRRWDTNQRHYRDELERLRREEEREQRALEEGDPAGIEEMALRMAFAGKHEAGRSYWFGQGVDVGELDRRARAAIAPPGGESALIERTHAG